MPPEMTTRVGVPIVRTGSYLLSTGPATFTEEDLAAAVAAYQNDPAVHAPRVKIDGLAESFNPEAHGGEPALGTITNLRIDANGQTVLGDVTVPKWLDEIADWAYPNRSIEGAQGVTTATGQSHDFVITGMALLGIDLPGVSTLPDLADLLANGPGAQGEALAPEEILAAAGWRGTPVHAGMDQDIVRRRFYEALDGEEMEIPEGVSLFDTWVVSIRFDDGGKPYLKALDDSDGRLYRIDFTISGNTVTFGKWAEVIEQDVPVAAGAPRPQTVRVWASRAESRPSPEVEESDVDIAAIREAAGLTAEQLPDDATPEQVAKALRIPAEGEKPEPEKPEGAVEPTPEEAPSEPKAEEAQVAAKAGTATIDAEELNRLRAAAEKAERLDARQRDQERDQTINAAIEAGKFGRGRRDHWVKAWAADPEGTRTLLTAKEEDGGLASGLVPTSEIGTASEGDGVAASGGTGWFPALNEEGR